MISLVSEKNSESFISACGFDEIIGARILTLLACYGLNSRFCLFWLMTGRNGKPSAAISRFNDRLVISKSADSIASADFDELSGFAAAMGDCRYIEAPPVVCKAVGVNYSYSEAHMLRYDCGVVFADDYSIINESPPLSEFYGVITAASPQLAETTDWSGWYTHTSHLLRHGLGFSALIRENGIPAASGGVFTASDKLAVISCIATVSEYRGQGYATLITKHLTDKILSQGKTPALFCESDKLADFYAALGFSCVGKWGQLIIKGNSERSFI